MDDSQLTYYYPPDLSTCKNLSINYDKYITRDPMIDEHIDALLDALICIRDREEQEQQQPQQTESKSSTQQKEDSQDGRDDDHATTTSSRPIPQKSSTKADFVCYRGILTKIMCTPYSRNDPWELRATLYKGTIYIEEHVSDEKRKDAHGVDDRHKLMSYWGYRFETICNISKPVSELQRIQTKKRRQQSDQGDRTDSVDKSDDNDGDHEMVEEVDPNDPELTGRLDGIANTNIQYCTVARTKLGRHSVIMGAEVDCTSEPKKPLPHNPLANYIELKTSRIISNARERNNFEKYKLIKFWAQSFLPGIPTIIVGFRDDDGNVVTVETFKTMEIPRLVRGKDGAWDSTVCINFLDGVFDFLRKIIVVDDPKATYTIRWDAPFEAIEVEYEGKVNDFLTERFLDRWSRVQ
ncbi:hypothetical protein BGX31_008510 [Mortierella sp. GBA43]|nr:hypothetical protein BGX31_008510 [Mortierella sp. GBA43]